MKVKYEFKIISVQLRNIISQNNLSDHKKRFVNVYLCCLITSNSVWLADFWRSTETQIQMKAIYVKYLHFHCYENNKYNIFNTCFRYIFIIIDYNVFIILVFFGKIMNKCFKNTLQLKECFWKQPFKWNNFFYNVLRMFLFYVNGPTT